MDVRRTAGEVTGLGKGATVALARREARRALAQKVVPKHLAELAALPSLKGKLNHKAYSTEDLTHALVLAVALDIRDAHRLEASAVCGTTYASLVTREKAVLDAARADQDLAQHVDLALTSQIDALETKRDSAEQAAHAGDLAMPAGVVPRLRQGADALDPDDLLEGLLATELRRRATALSDQIDATDRLQWADRRAKAVQAATDRALADSRYLAAVDELRKKSYVSAHEMLLGQATLGDATAEFAVGYMEAQALGARRDYADALVWLKRSATQNYGPAKAMIGLLTFSGHAGKANAEEAAKWLGSALDDGWSCEAELTRCLRRPGG